MFGAIHKDAQLLTTTSSLAWLYSSPVGPKIHLAPETGVGGDAADGISEDDAMNTLLNRWKEDAPKEPSEEEEEDNEDDPSNEDGDTEDSEETPEDEGDDEDEGDEDEEDNEDDEESEDDKEAQKKPKVLKDTDVVKVKVGDQELDVQVKDLKRLYGQEKALTQKSQEASAKLKKAEEDGLRHVVASENLLKRAQERYKPYATIDWLVAAQKLSSEELTALRDEATAAYQDIKYLETDLSETVKQAQQAQHTALVEEAKQTLKALSDPKTGIKGFNQEMYGQIRQYAIDQGVPSEVADKIVSEPLLRMAHKAMMLDKGQKAVTKPTVDKKNKKVIKKGKVNSEVTRSVITKGKDQDAMKRLRTTGSQEDAAAALMARWAKED